MATDPPEQPEQAAVEQLEQLGLSKYAAETFVGLVGLGNGTARDVSEVTDVPRTRVYDAVEELQKWGFVDVQQSNPKQFWVTSTETTRRKFEREFRERTQTLQQSLNEISPVTTQKRQQGVWTVEGQRSVTERVIEFIRNAEEEIVYMTVEDLLTDPLVDALSEAADRGVSIKIAGISPDVQEHLLAEIPEADVFESLWVWSDTPTGRLLMTDQNRTLVSVMANNGDSTPRTETAIWGAGEVNSLVVVLRAIFTWRLERQT